MHDTNIVLVIFGYNVCLGFAVGEPLNIISALLSILFLIAFKLPKFIFYLSKSYEMIKKLRKGSNIDKKELEEIYKDKDES